MIVDREIVIKGVEKLDKLRKRISKIYMELGNPEYVNADWELKKDIKYLKKNYAIGGLDE